MFWGIVFQFDFVSFQAMKNSKTPETLAWMLSVLSFLKWLNVNTISQYQCCLTLSRQEWYQFTNPEGLKVWFFEWKPSIRAVCDATDVCRATTLPIITITVCCWIISLKSRHLFSRMHCLYRSVPIAGLLVSASFKGLFRSEKFWWISDVEKVFCMSSRSI